MTPNLTGLAGSINGLGGAQGHFVVAAEDGVNVRLGLEQILHNVQCVGAGVVGGLLGYDFNAGVLGQSLLTADNAVNGGLRTGGTLNDEDLTGAAHGLEQRLGGIVALVDILQANESLVLRIVRNLGVQVDNGDTGIIDLLGGGDDIVFNPSRNGIHYDVYALLRKDEKHIVQHMREIVDAIMPIPNGIKDEYWIDLGRDLLTGAMIYYYERGHGFIGTMLLIQDTPASKLCKKIMANGSPLARSFIGNLTSLKPEQCAGIGSEINRHIRIFATDPDIQAALSPDEGDAGSFSWEDIAMNRDAPVVFLCVNQDRLEQWSGVLRLMVTQLVRTLERRPEKHSPQGASMEPLLLLMDEFPLLGKMDVIQNAITTLRSKKVTFYITIQSIAQIDAIYGEDFRKILMDNCQYKAILQVSDPDSQEYFSRLFGTVLCPKTGVSSSWNTESDGITLGTNTHEEREPRVNPQEFATNDDILLQTPHGVFRVKKQLIERLRPYYYDWIINYFNGRMN